MSATDLQRGRAVAVQARDRVVEVISELRGIECDLDEAVRWGFLNQSTVECETNMNLREALVLVVDALLSAEHSIKRADQRPVADPEIRHAVTDSGLVTEARIVSAADDSETQLRTACAHVEIHPYVPEDRERPMHGAYQCNACDEVLAEIQCSVCSVQLLPHRLAAHLTERCWAT